MANYALINENNIVTRILFVDNTHILDENGNENYDIGISLCKEGLNDPDARLIRTSINNNIRVHYAAIGSTYDEDLDAFIPPKPYPSWVLNNSTADWDPPIPYPNDENQYQWNEETQSWDLIELPTE